MNQEEADKMARDLLSYILVQLIDTYPALSKLAGRHGWNDFIDQLQKDVSEIVARRFLR